MKQYLKSKLLYLLAIILIVIAVGLIGLYVYTFNNGLSNVSSDWGAFGAYFGAITGLLAFGGVLWSINDSNKQNKETSERDTFFKLLDLHTNKFNNVEYKDSTNNSVFAAEAFKEYTNEANSYFQHIIAYRYILDEIDSGKTINDLENLFFNKYKRPNNEIKYFILKCTEVDADEKIKSLRENLEKNIVPKADHGIMATVEIALEEKPLSTNELYEYGKKAADAIYHKYGHITGHYFRNLYYAMKITSRFSNNNNYQELLRAQISRYEIAMNLYNALSSRSSVGMINLLNKYEIFDDKYKSDIYILQILPEDIVLNDLLEKSKEHLQSINRTGR